MSDGLVEREAWLLRIRKAAAAERAAAERAFALKDAQAALWSDAERAGVSRPLIAEASGWSLGQVKLEVTRARKPAVEGAERRVSRRWRG